MKIEDLNEIINNRVKTRKKNSYTNKLLKLGPKKIAQKFGEEASFKKGVGRIYNSLNLPCIPVALNSGKIWPKNSFIKHKGDIHISFLEPIMPGKNKDEFVKEIENKIYSEIKKFE